MERSYAAELQNEPDGEEENEIEFNQLDQRNQLLGLIPVGSIVTVGYDRISADDSVPIQARIIRIRSDIDWDTVLSEYFRSVPQPKVLNGTLPPTIE